MRKLVIFIVLVFVFSFNLFASVENFNKYNVASKDGFTVVKVGVGILSKVNITSRDMTGVVSPGNKKMKGIVIYDGTLSGVTVTGKSMGAYLASVDEYSIPYEAEFVYGLVVENNSSADVVTVYR